MSHLSRLSILAVALTVLASFTAIFKTTSAKADFGFKIDSFLMQKLAEGKSVGALVRMAGQADISGAEKITDRTARVQYVYEHLRDVANRSQADIIKYLDQKKVAYHAFYITNSIWLYAATPELLNEIAARSDVQKIKYNATSALQLPPQTHLRHSDPDAAYQDNITDIHVDRVWNELHVKGKGIVVAGQDSGYNWNHPAIHNQYRGVTANGVDHNYNWHDAIHKTAGGPCGVDSLVPCDNEVHGTHTMGTMVGDDGGANHIGVAPEAKWIGCRNMDNDIGSVATYTECFEFFLAPYPLGGDPRKQGRPDLAPHIVNNSWGCPETEGCTGNEFIEVVRALKAAGIMVIVALGNDGPDCGSVTSPPGTYYGDVLTVGAYDHSGDSIASFSSRGPSSFNGAVGPDIVAPGNIVRSAVNAGSDCGDSSYCEMSGTSMASPHMVGVVALLWSAHPELIGQIQKTIDLIHKTATARTTDLTCGSFAGSAIPNTTFGYGLVDAYKLLTTR
jgi:serine protease AprX